jgi:REP element-mobilizing transposase RayT
MSDRYKATMPGEAYFITTTVVDWIRLFSNPIHQNIIIESLIYCCKEKGLEIYAWCLMPSHLHMICKAKDDDILANVMRDFKKFTSKKIIQLLQQESNEENAQALQKFAEACGHLKRRQEYKVWQNGYHAVLLRSNKFIYQKLNYIHNNPVKAGLVNRPEEFMYSSARNYADLEALFEVILLPPQMITVK